MVNKKQIPPAVFGLTVLVGFGMGVWFVAKTPRWGLIDAVFMVVGLVLGIGLMPAMATPFVPSPPQKGGILQQFIKIYMTISSMILEASVFYLKGGGQYVRKRVEIDGDTVSFVVNGTRETWDGAKQRFVTFGRRPLGLAWSEDHPMYQAILKDQDVETDGGQPVELVNMDHLHRMLRSVNQLRTIDAAVKDAKDEYGGGDDGPGTFMILGIAIFMMMLGSLTVWFAMGG